MFNFLMKNKGLSPYLHFIEPKMIGTLACFIELVLVYCAIDV